MSWIDVGASVFVSALSIRFLVILWAARGRDFGG